MAYMFHITRNPDMDDDGRVISLAEWIDAVSEVEHVRLATGDYSVRVPDTGQILTLPNNGGDTELFFPAQGEWRRVFRWHAEGVTFRGVADFDEPGCQLRAVARALAGRLNAVLCGDEGEIYL